MTTTLFPIPLPLETHSPGKIILLSPRDAERTMRAVEHVTVMMLDPWYNKGVGGTRPDYIQWLSGILLLASSRADHVFLWGFPEIIWRVLPDAPATMQFTSWLTWYFKNCPSVIRGWRSAQMACLHFAKPGAKIYPEHFLNEAQISRKNNGKLRYMPGPATVIEAPLNIGFVGRNEQTGHPAQKPEIVIEWLLRMVTIPGDTVCDPFCGSGTTGAVCARLHLDAVLGDHDEEYTKLVERRLGIKARRNMP
jgi:site-specific DNA-methyltransferase (adenine-specific)